MKMKKNVYEKLLEKAKEINCFNILKYNAYGDKYFTGWGKFNNCGDIEHDILSFQSSKSYKPIYSNDNIKITI